MPRCGPKSDSYSLYCQRCGTTYSHSLIVRVTPAGSLGQSGWPAEALIVVTVCMPCAARLSDSEGCHSGGVAAARTQSLCCQSHCHAACVCTSGSSSARTETVSLLLLCQVNYETS